MAERKLMHVGGYDLPTEIEDAAVAWMREPKNGPFQASDVTLFLWRAGVPVKDPNQNTWSPAYRIADRLIQREKKARTIHFLKGRWRHPEPRS